MSTCRHEIIKGDQLDTDLGSHLFFIRVGIPDHHFEKEVY